MQINGKLDIFVNPCRKWLFWLQVSLDKVSGHRWLVGRLRNRRKHLLLQKLMVCCVLGFCCWGYASELCFWLWAFTCLKHFCLLQEGFFARLVYTRQDARLLTCSGVTLLCVWFCGLLEDFCGYCFLVYLHRSLKRVGIQKSIFRLCCHWPKRESRKGR